MPSSFRPQTLKQAKRAYRKSTTPRLSASELAQAERRAALQERADRIKAREARRKANLKKREEKIAREREAAKRMGRPFPDDTKSSWKIGPSQLSLGGFLGGVQKPYADQEQEALKALRPDENREDIKAKALREQEVVNKLVTCMSPPGRHDKALAMQDNGNITRGEQKEQSLISSAMRMPPPPPKPQSKSIIPIDDVSDDCFPSNTQIERELSPSLTEPSTTPLAALPTIRPVSFSQTATSPYSEAAEDLLAYISTQDLDFEDETSRPASTPKANESDALLAQICTQDLDFSDDNRPEMTKPTRADFDDGLADDDLEQLAIEFDEGEVEYKFAAKKSRPEWSGSMRAVCKIG